MCVAVDRHTVFFSELQIVHTTYATMNRNFVRRSSEKLMNPGEKQKKVTPQKQLSNLEP